MAIGFNLESDNNGFEEGYTAAKREFQSEIEKLKEEIRDLKNKLKNKK